MVDQEYSGQIEQALSFQVHHYRHVNDHVPARSHEFDGVLPADLAERPVLALVLLEPRRISDVAAVLEPADFMHQTHRTIFEAMLRLWRRGLPADATIVIGELRDAGLFNAEDGVSARRWSICSGCPRWRATCPCTWTASRQCHAAVT